MSIWMRLIEAMAEAEEERKKKEQLSTLGGVTFPTVDFPQKPLNGWKIIPTPFAPPRTLYVSHDVYEALKEACDDRARRI